jgi:hypothetical protein
MPDEGSLMPWNGGGKEPDSNTTAQDREGDRLREEVEQKQVVKPQRGINPKKMTTQKAGTGISSSLVELSIHDQESGARNGASAAVGKATGGVETGGVAGRAIERAVRGANKTATGGEGTGARAKQKTTTTEIGKSASARTRSSSLPRN